MRNYQLKKMKLGQSCQKMRKFDEKLVLYAF